ncbi:MAG: hypothetical protein N2Z58_04920 [Fervidobacterium sp.]|nr:hypothetical protein [Fervidobacterium sp.]
MKRNFNPLVVEGLILLIVIMLHTFAPKLLVTFFSYGIPVLFFVRGYQWHDRPFRNLIFSRLQLILTYYFVGILGTILFVLFSPEEILIYQRQEYFKNLLLARVIKGDEIAIIIAPLWFLLALFVSDVFYHFSRKNTTILITVILFGIALRFLGLKPLLFRIGTALISIPFTEIGRWAKEKRVNIKWYALLISLAVFIVIVLVNGEVSWYTHNFHNVLLTFIGEFSLLPIALFVGSTITNTFVKNFLQKLAMNALFVFSYHGIISALVAIMYFPIIKAIGFTDIFNFLYKFWYVHFSLTVFALIISINYIPNNIKRILIGDVRFLIARHLKNSGGNG